MILLYAPANSTGLQLRFTNMNVGLSDFVEDPANPNVYTYTLPGNAPASTSVIFVSGDVVTVNGAEQGNSGSVEVAIPPAMAVGQSPGPPTRPTFWRQNMAP